MTPHTRDPSVPVSTQVFELGGTETPESSTPTTENGPFSSPSRPSSTIDGDADDSQMSVETLGNSSETTESSSEPEEHELGSSHTERPPQRRILHSSSSTLLMAGAFAPPFYNRPPTPLPPSPSLTSLLRPSFSTTTSRPSTPDDSDMDTPNDAESAVAKSARIASTVPRASPKVPTYEYYGFVLYLLSSLGFVMYLLWSYLPSPFLHQLGIYYYPNRWWSLAIPAFLVMTIVYIYVALASYNTGYLTLSMNSIENIVDEAAQVAALDNRGGMLRKPGGARGGYSAADRDSNGLIDWKRAWSEGTDAVMDVPIGGVCEILYGGD